MNKFQEVSTPLFNYDLLNVKTGKIKIKAIQSQDSYEYLYASFGIKDYVSKNPIVLKIWQKYDLDKWKPIYLTQYIEQKKMYSYWEDISINLNDCIKDTVTSYLKFEIYEIVKSEKYVLKCELEIKADTILSKVILDQKVKDDNKDIEQHKQSEKINSSSLNQDIIILNKDNNEKKIIDLTSKDNNNNNAENKINDNNNNKLFKYEAEYLMKSKNDRYRNFLCVKHLEIKKVFSFYDYLISNLELKTFMFMDLSRSKVNLEYYDLFNQLNFSYNKLNNSELEDLNNNISNKFNNKSSKDQDYSELSKDLKENNNNYNYLKSIIFNKNSNANNNSNTHIFNKTNNLKTSNVNKYYNNKINSKDITLKSYLHSNTNNKDTINNINDSEVLSNNDKVNFKENNNHNSIKTLKLRSKNTIALIPINSNNLKSIDTKYNNKDTSILKNTNSLNQNILKNKVSIDKNTIKCNLSNNVKLLNSDINNDYYNLNFKNITELSNNKDSNSKFLNLIYNKINKFNKYDDLESEYSNEGEENEEFEEESVELNFNEQIGRLSSKNKQKTEKNKINNVTNLKNIEENEQLANDNFILEKLDLVNPKEQFQVCLDTLIKFLIKLDSSRGVPFFCFGAKLPPLYDNVVNCFSSTMDVMQPEVDGYLGFFDTYTKLLSKVNLYGPANLSESMENLIKFVSTDKFSDKEQAYAIAVFIVSSRITDLIHTIKLIIKSSYYPCSIIVIGIGYEFQLINNNSFEEYNYLNNITNEDIYTEIYDNYGMKITERPLRQNSIFIDFDSLYREYEYQLRKESIYVPILKKIISSISNQFLEYVNYKEIPPLDYKNLSKKNHSHFLEFKKEKLNQEYCVPNFLIKERENIENRLTAIGFQKEDIDNYIPLMPSFELNYLISTLTYYKYMLNKTPYDNIALRYKYKSKNMLILNGYSVIDERYSNCTNKTSDNYLENKYNENVMEELKFKNNLEDYIKKQEININYNDKNDNAAIDYSLFKSNNRHIKKPGALRRKNIINKREILEPNKKEDNFNKIMYDKAVDTLQNCKINNNFTLNKFYNNKSNNCNLENSQVLSLYKKYNLSLTDLKVNVDKEDFLIDEYYFDLQSKIYYYIKI